LAPDVAHSITDGVWYNAENEHVAGASVDEPTSRIKYCGHNK